MSKKHETGKITIPQNTLSQSVDLQETYTEIPAIKITTNKNINIFINNVTSSSFSIEKSETEEAIIYYTVIGN